MARALSLSSGLSLSGLSLTALPLLGVLLTSSVATAQAPRRVSDREAVRLAMAENPALKAALIDVQQSDAEVDAAEGVFTPIFSADAGYTHSTSPRAQPDSYTFSESDLFSLGSGLSHQFPWGTSVGFRLEGQRRTASAAGLGVAGGQADSGPTYNLLGRATVVHPLMRGSGREIGEAGLRQARLARTSSERSRDAAASSLLRDVLSVYWELWYQGRAEEIERKARDTAKRQRDEADQRIQAGALAPIELLSFETRLAQLEQGLASTEATTRQRGVELARLLGQESSSPFTSAGGDAPTDLQMPISETDAYRLAMDESPDIKAQEAQLAQARERIITAGESRRARLDLEAYVQGESAAYQEVPPVASRFVTEPAVSVHVGVVFEMPLSGQVRQANERVALLAVESAKARLESSRQGLRAQVAAVYVKADTARRRVELAQRTVTVAEKQLAGQRARYEQGAAILLEVQQAEDSLRQAQLSVERARVDHVSAIIDLEQITGRLLARYANLVPNSVRQAAQRKQLRAVASIGPL